MNEQKKSYPRVSNQLFSSLFQNSDNYEQSPTGNHVFYKNVIALVSRVLWYLIGDGAPS